MGDADEDGVVQLVLRARDLAMMAQAASFNLRDVDERLRSVTALSDLFFQLCTIAGPDVFIEAGAKEAGASRRARRRFNPSRIVAFEASPYTFAHFDRRHDNAAVGVEYLHLALSDTPGDVSFNVRRNSEGEGRVDGLGSMLAREGEPDPDIVTVTVTATTLDLFFASQEIKHGAMWMDVEGATEQVMLGGAAVLDHTDVLIVEVEDRPYFIGQWLADEVTMYLHHRGLVPVARDFQSRYQYNVVYLRDALLKTDRIRWALVDFLSQTASSRPSPPALVRSPTTLPEPDAGAPRTFG